MIEVKGEVRLGIVLTNADDGDYWTIEIKDDTSSVRFAKLKIKAADVPKLFAQRHTPCEIELSNLDMIGTTRETKSEFVPGELTEYRRNERRIQELEAVMPYEIDGWKARQGDFGNGHRSAKRDGVNGYNVTFIRFVRPDGTPVL